MAKKITHREVYNRMKKAAKTHLKYSYQIGNYEREKFGFEFSETNDDQIIDTLDYGISDLSFENYLKAMNEYKKKFNNGGEYKN